MAFNKHFLFAVAAVVAFLGASALIVHADPATAGSPVSAPAQTTIPTNVGQQRPNVSEGPAAANQFEKGTSVLSLPDIMRSQWSLKALMPPESVISERYLRQIDNTVRRLTLKQVIYIALKNNPSVQAVELSPVASTEAVRSANAVFDPDFQGSVDQIKNVVPATTALESASSALSTKNYDWNFTLTKISALTNGTFSATFNNTRQMTNNLTQTINPSYNSNLNLSVSQPLMRNFGWGFATINVRLAESAQKQAQWSMAQNLMSFVQRVGNDYWGLVLAAENLEVAREALKFNQDLVRDNRISVRVGTLAPLDLQEAQSAEATAAANVFTAEAQLKTARVALREDVMLNPRHAFLPQIIIPADQPNPQIHVDQNEIRSLRLAVLYQPALGGMREAIRQSLIQVKFQENQILPQVNVQAQFGNSALAGNVLCSSPFGNAALANCFNPSLAPIPGQPLNGVELPFKGGYGRVLNHLFNFGFYNYAAVLSFERPIDNAAARSALAQARAVFAQSRMQYRASLAQVVVQVENALANVHADFQRVKATKQATYYARRALHDEQVRFRVGLATTHDLLQFQNELVSAEGNEVQADVDLQNAVLALEEAKGTILIAFNIHFQVQNPHETPWYVEF